MATPRPSPDALWKLAVDILRDEARYPQAMRADDRVSLAYGVLVMRLGPSEAEMWMLEMGL